MPIKTTNARMSKLRLFGVAVMAGSLLFAGLTPAQAASPTPRDWSSPTAVSWSSPNTRSPQVVVAPDGSLTAVWTYANGNNDIVQASFSTGPDAGWSNPKLVSDPGQYASNPQLVVAADGSVTVVWESFDYSTRSVQSSSLAASGAVWSDPVVISGSVQYTYAPQVAVAPSGARTAVWAVDIGGDMIVQSSSSAGAGAAWSAPLSVSLAGSNAESPQIVAAADGAFTAVWASSTGGDVTVQSSSSAGAGAAWSAPLTVSLAGRSARDPQVAIAADGVLTAVWARDNGVGTDTIIQSSSSAGAGAAWSAPATVSASGQTMQNPQVVVAADGARTAVWEGVIAGKSTVQTSSSAAPGAAWSAPVALSGLSEMRSTPQVAVATDGSLTAIWTRYVGGNDVVQSSSSAAPGAAWSAPVNLSATDFSAFSPHVVVHATGAVTAVWGSRVAIDLGLAIQSSSSLKPFAGVVDRLAGPDRFATSAEIAKKYVSADVVFVANGLGYADALSAAPAAALLKAPLLLSEKDSIPAGVKAQIVRLAPKTIYVVGGSGVVSDAVFNQLKAVASVGVVRLGGADRYATSQAVFDKIWAGKTVEDVFLADGRNFPDALSSASAAAFKSAPVVLVDGGSATLPAGFGAVLARFGTTAVMLAGGSAVLSRGIETALNNMSGVTVHRYFGADRYKTSIAINSAFFTHSSHVYLAVGSDYADALAGAALAGKDGAPLYLVPGTCVPRDVLHGIDSLGATTVTLLGGPGVLSVGVENLRSCASGS